MLLRAKILLPAGLLICVAGAALAGLERERLVFVGKCWSNNNPLAKCNCTFNALPELSENYRDHAVSWAHNSGVSYGAGQIYLVWKEAVRIGSEKVPQTSDFNDWKKMIRSGLRWVAQSIGLEALRQAAPSIEPTVAAVAIALPLVDNAVEKLADAHRVYDRHCGTGETLIVQISDASNGVKKFVEALPAQSMDVVTRTGAATAEASASTARRFWPWLTSWF